MTPRPTILLVDDLPSEVVTLGETLSALGEVLFATSGPEALEVAAKAHPDLIILDVVMPGMDGLEVCRRLKADPRLAPTPIVFLTIQIGQEEEFEGLQLGAVDYLAKPTAPSLVSARVRNHLQHKALFEQQCALVEELRRALGARDRAGATHRRCAWCRRVRDARGAWTPLDGTVQSAWAFTVCPDCIKDVLREASPEGN